MDPLSPKALEAAARAASGALIAAYKAGFGNSAEGYNAEYGPLDDDVTDTAIEETKDFAGICAKATILAYLQALSAEGYGVVPREATEGMLHQGALAGIYPTVPMGGPGHSQLMKAHQYWRAMFDAAQERKP